MSDTLTVHIPGAVHAVLEDGEVTGITFTPHAGHPGYFGPSHNTIAGDDMAEDDLWDAISKHLAATNGQIEWEE